MSATIRVFLLSKNMNAASRKLVFLMIFLIIASSVPFRRMLGAEAQTCETNEQCQKRCDPGGCKLNCLGRSSYCTGGLCGCAMGTGFTSTIPLPGSTCTVDHDCFSLCPPSCNARHCQNAQCQCGCEA